MRPLGIRTHRQRGVLVLAWVLLWGLTVLRVLLGPGPGYLYRLIAAAWLYLLIRTGIVLRGEVPFWAEYGFILIDAAWVSVTVRLLGGMASDFYLAYFFVLAEGALTLDLWFVAALSAWVTLGGLAATWPGLLVASWDVAYRLFFLLVAGGGASWVASREAGREREVTRLREQLLLAEERRRLAREIHDGVGHILAAGAQSLELAERLLPADPQRVAALLPEAKRLLRRGLDEIRFLVLGLQPPGSSAGDAVVVARQHLAALAARTQISTEVRSQEPAIPLSPASEFAFRRILQESLTNVARHARAGRVTVTLECSDALMTCRIADDGVGLPSGAERGAGFGLQHMRERAAELGGTLDVSGTPGGGTTVTLTLPRLAKPRAGNSAP